MLNELNIILKESGAIGFFALLLAENVYIKYLSSINNPLIFLVVLFWVALFIALLFNSMIMFGICVIGILIIG